MKSNSQSNSTLNDEIEKKNQLKKQKKTRSIVLTHYSNYEMRKTQ
jgi:hypothetical protein